MLNISKYYLGRNGHFLAYSSGLMFGRVISTIAFRDYSVRIGYQREQNYTEIVLKHVF